LENLCHGWEHGAGNGDGHLDLFWSVRDFSYPYDSGGINGKPFASGSPGG